MGKSLIIVTGGGTDTEEGNANAVESTVLQGYTFFGFGDDDPRTGTMPNKTGGGTTTLNAGGSVTIQKGYYLNNTKVTANSLSSHTSANADAGHIITGYSGWKNGSKINGSMPNKGTTNGSIGVNGTYTIPAGWHNGSGKVTQSLSTQGGTTVTPGTSQKTVIAASKWSTGNQVVAGSGNLTAGNIKKNVNIFGVVGTMSGFPGGDYWIIQNGVMLVDHYNYDASTSDAYGVDWTAMVYPYTSGDSLILTWWNHDDDDNSEYYHVQRTWMFNLPLIKDWYMQMFISINRVTDWTGNVGYAGSGFRHYNNKWDSTIPHISFDASMTVTHKAIYSLTERSTSGRKISGSVSSSGGPPTSSGGTSNPFPTTVPCYLYGSVPTPSLWGSPTAFGQAHIKNLYVRYTAQNPTPSS